MRVCGQLHNPAAFPSLTGNDPVPIVEEAG
jgi:hypothetical protein